MKVLMFPGRAGTTNGNLYIDILVGALRALGVEVRHWQMRLPWQSGDIFHIHWPEWPVGMRFRLDRAWVGHNMLETARRVRRAGGKVLWTVHNVAPHDPAAASDPYWNALMAAFLPLVDAYLVLTEAGLPQIWETYPALRNKPWFLTRHPHYRGPISPPTYDPDLKTRLGVGRDRKLVAMLGELRPDKEAEALIAAAAALTDPPFHLIVSGLAAPSYASSLEAAAKESNAITLNFRIIPQEKLVEFYAAVDILAFPGRSYFNSGTIYTALSMNVPVLAYASPTNVETQGLVGREWLYLFESGLASEVFLNAFGTVTSRNGAVCDLAAFHPHICAAQTRDAYDAVLRA